MAPFKREFIVVCIPMDTTKTDNNIEVQASASILVNPDTANESKTKKSTT